MSAAMSVWKFELARGNTGPRKVTLEMPSEAEVLSVGVQQRDGKEIMCLWAGVVPGKATKQRTFYLAFTGEDLGSAGQGWEFVGTCLCVRGELVMHVFEVL